MRRHLKIISFLILTTQWGCSDSSSTEEEPQNFGSLRENIISASVAFAYQGDVLNNYLASPKRAAVSGYFWFEEDLGDDVIFGLDIEWLEGVNNPIHISGGDWMGLAGFTRKGILWFPVGSLANRDGIPTDTDTWEIRDIGFDLSPNTWYQMTIIVDFELREFDSITLEGPNLNTTIDISGFALEYPNYAPFDEPSLTFYTFALRGKEFAPTPLDNAAVYFDDISSAVEIDGEWTTVFANGFEDQSQIQDIPVQLPVSPMANIQENFWYFENENALIDIQEQYVRSGSKALRCDADLTL
ncbi:MAG: hypothetical protein AAF554_00215 [Bacteroidota bacterium]